MLEDIKRGNITKRNRHMAALAEKYWQYFINVNEGLADENNDRKQEVSIDSVHMYAAPCEVIFNNIKKHI